VIGLDLSLTSTGISRITWIDTSVVTDIHRVQSVGKLTDTWPMRSKRLRDLAHAITEHVLPANLVVLEGPSFNSKSPASHDRSWFWGKVYDAIEHYPAPILVVPPASAKKWATGKGNADKDDMILAAARMWPAVEGIKNDTADALALAGIGMQLLYGPCPFPLYSYRTAVVDGLRAELDAVV
jgi:Holliday junction resolvasome RuvABC endonuclease subunit